MLRDLNALKQSVGGTMADSGEVPEQHAAKVRIGAVAKRMLDDLRCSRTPLLQSRRWRRRRWRSRECVKLLVGLVGFGSATCHV